MVMDISNGISMHSPQDGLIEQEVITNDSDSSFPVSDELVGHQEIVNINGTELLNLDTLNGITALTDCNGTIFLLVTSSNEEAINNINCDLRNSSSSSNSQCNDKSNNIAHNTSVHKMDINIINNDDNACINNSSGNKNQKVICKNTLVKNISYDGNRESQNNISDSINSSDGSNIDNCNNNRYADNQTCDSDNNTCSSVETGCPPSPQVQIINRDGIAVDINVNDLLTTLDAALKRDETPISTPKMIPTIDSNPNLMKTEVQPTDLSSRDAVRNLTSVVERTNILTNSRVMHHNNNAGDNIQDNSRNEENCTSCQVISSSNFVGNVNGNINRNTSSNNSNSNNINNDVGNHHSAMTNTHQDVPPQRDTFVMTNKMPRVPNWAMCLQDCSLQGDMFIGYVQDENEVDAVLNLYKKETQSLFATRQTPSPAKDDGAASDAVRLMWKSQYVPYDGIPFVNMGRRATVLECEFGPRKRNNAIKRMMQMRSAVLAGNASSDPKSPILTCPVRLFVKKVLKFPQYRVSRDADAKVLRQLQEQSLKHVRESGFQKGEVRWYIQFPLPSSHRYHNCGPPLEVLPKEAKNITLAPSDTSFIDSRVLTRIQQIVRQGFVNPFLVRTATKEFVENQMKLDAYEQVPLKHNKHFYPPLIEIQNIIQQTQAALKSGIIAPLPVPTCPLITQKAKRKRFTCEEDEGISALDDSRVVKRLAVHHNHGNTTSTPHATANSTNINAVAPSTMTSSESVMASPEPSDEGGGGKGEETISLTLTDTQLNNLSLNSFSYTQLAQLAKIGLLALNNATKETLASQDEEAMAQSNVAADIQLKTEIEESEDDPRSPLPHNCSSALQASPLPHNCSIASSVAASSSDEKKNDIGPGVLAALSDSDSLGTSSRLTHVDVVR